MISIQSVEVKEKIAGWQIELQAITEDPKVRLVPIRDVEVKLDLESISDIVSYVTGVEYEKLISKSRKRPIPIARQLVCYFGYRRYDITWKKIGEYLGGRDHTTVMFGHKTIKDLLKIGDSQIVDYVERIKVYCAEVQSRLSDQKRN